MSAIPEADAAARVGAYLSRYAEGRYLTEAFWTMVGGKAIAGRDVLRRMFDELDADPARLRERDVKLQQDATSQVDSVEYWAEHLHHIRRELEDAEAIYERVRRAHHVDRYDPDDVTQDREDDRSREERQDERAAREAVRP